MKLMYCAALLAAGCAQAGELLPMTGQESEHVQRAIDAHLQPAVASLPATIKVQPVLESIDISGRGKRVFCGPLAGKSHVVLRVEIIDGEAVVQQTFTERGGAWKGTFRPGRDYEMVNTIATQAAEFVSAYGK